MSAAGERVAAVDRVIEAARRMTHADRLDCEPELCGEGQCSERPDDEPCPDCALAVAVRALDEIDGRMCRACAGTGRRLNQSGYYEPCDASGHRVDDEEADAECEEPVGPECFGGSDEGSHYMAQISAARLRADGGES